MVKIVSLLVFSVALSFATNASAAKNLRLAAAMTVLKQELSQVSYPSKIDSTEVKSEVVLAAIMRAKTARFVLSEIKGKKGAIVAGKLVENDFTPAVIKANPDKATELLASFENHLEQASQKFVTAERQLEVELAKSKRDFGALGTTISELGEIIRKGHAIFNP